MRSALFASALLDESYLSDPEFLLKNLSKWMPKSYVIFAQPVNGEPRV